jgi:hypothetical protein
MNRMPVNRVSGPAIPAKIDSTPTENTPVADTTTPSAGGWSAGNSAQKQVLNLTVPAPSASDIRASMPNPVRAQLDAALTNFTTRVETTLGHDAMSIARGAPAVREGDALTSAQQDGLKNASTDLLKSIPIGALSPEVASTIQNKLEAAGISTRDISGTKLGDLGQIGGDIAKDLVKDLKENSPAAYYSLAASLGAAAGILAYTGGSAKLAKFGIKPEVKTKFFDDKLEVKLRGDWDAHFKNFKATATVGAHVDLGNNGTISGSISANSATGFDNARIQYDLNRPNLNLSAYATANTGGLENIGGSVSYRPNENMSLSAAVNHNLQTDRTTASAEAAWKMNNNVDLALSGSHDSRGDSRIGVGVRIHF